MRKKILCRVTAVGRNDLLSQSLLRQSRRSCAYFFVRLLFYEDGAAFFFEQSTLGVPEQSPAHSLPSKSV